MARGNVTTDGEGIRAFVEKGGGHPARVIRTGVSAPRGAKAGRGSRAAGGGSSRRGRSSAGRSVRS